MKKTLKRILVFSALLALVAATALVMTGCECTHYYDETVTKQPTCMEDGELYRECVMCGDTNTLPIYASEEYHVLEEVSVEAPTCGEAGKRNMICTLCGFEGYYELPATNEHSYEVTSLTEPSCTEFGQRIETCSGCGNVKSGMISALGHDWGDPVTTNATCTVDGSIVTSCTRCDEETVEVITASHRYSEATVTVPATCEEDGREEYTCTVCLDSGYNVLPALGHNSVDAVAVAPTCETEGITVGTRCDRCDATLTGREPIPVVSHSYGDNAACVWCQTLKTYTVTYVTGTDAVVPAEVYSHGQTIILPDGSALENDHTAFVGWFTSDDVEYTATTTVTGDVTLYAKVDSYVPVSDLSGLLAIASAPDKSYKLTGNIDAEGVVWAPVDDFTGSLNGDGFVIYNIVLTTTESRDFGFVRVNNGTIKNLSFKDFTFNATYTYDGTRGYGVVAGVNNGTISGVRIFDGRFMINATRYASGGSTVSSYGAITGRNTQGAEVSECYVNLNIEVNLISNNNSGSGTYWDGTSVSGTFYLGGIVGRNESRLSTCEFEGAITCDAQAVSTEAGWDNHYATNTILLGTVVGENVGAVERCYTKGEISTSASSNRGSSRNYYSAGVLVGKNLNGGTVEFSYAAGKIVTGSATTANTGGFIGFNEANSYVKSCYTTANVEASGGAYIGGFIGNNSGIVQNSYAAGEVLSEGSGRTGGFVGSLNSAGTISKSYSTGDVAAAGGDVGHFVGYAEGVVLKCYFMDSSTVMSGGTYLPIVTEYNTIEGIVYTKLWNEDFLINEMYWEDYGWIVVADENPLLAWEIDKNHNFVTATVEPTCERGGFTIYNCTDCSRLFIKDYVDALGHDMVTDSVIPASCSARGFTEKHCQTEGCGYEVEEDFTEKIPHAEENLSVEAELAATCIAEGYTRYKCSECGNADIFEYHDPVGHDGTLVSVLIEVSCDGKGLEEYFCSREGCGEYTVIIDEIPHTPEAVPYLAPSCGKDFDSETGDPIYNSRDGHMPGEICSVCGEILSGCEPLPAHTFELNETVTAAGCLTEGEGVYVCFDCGFTKNDVIAAVGHKDTNLNNVCDVCEGFTFADVPESLFVRITDAAGLDAIRNNLSGYYILDADIDLTDYDWTPIGTELQPFKGMLYGNGHTVKGLKLRCEGSDVNEVYGLFGYSKGTIVSVNVSALDIIVQNAHCVIGGVVAYNMGSVISCNLTGDSVVDLKLNLDVTDYTHHTLERVMVVGGIVGINDQTGTVKYCNSTGNVMASIESTARISSSGAYNFVLALIHNTKAETDLDVSFGAIAGRNRGTLDNCKVNESVGINLNFVAELAYQKGRIDSAFNVYAASLVGYNSGTVTACNTAGAVYSYREGYNYKNFIDKYFKGKLCEITVTFVNHTDDSAHPGFVGGNEGAIIN